MAVPGSAGLSDIRHVVILMQENQSVDHYFGTMSAARGFSDPHVLTRDVGGVQHPVVDQFGYRPGKGPDPTGYLQPFRLLSDPPLANGQTTGPGSRRSPGDETPVAAYITEYPAACALDGRASRSARLRVNCTPDCNWPRVDVSTRRRGRAEWSWKNKAGPSRHEMEGPCPVS